MIQDPHETYKRTSCECQRCQAACHCKPGFLIPGDLERIHDSVKHQEKISLDAFVMQHFEASEGATVMAEGRVFKIPTIVPRLLVGGACTFLRGESCSIHRVAPFGCAFFDVCSRDYAQGQARSHDGLAWIMQEAIPSGYAATWRLLAAHGLVAQPLAMRQMLFETWIRQIEHDRMIPENQVKRTITRQRMGNDECYFQWQCPECDNEVLEAINPEWISEGQTRAIRGQQRLIASDPICCYCRARLKPEDERCRLKYDSQTGCYQRKPGR